MDVALLRHIEVLIRSERELREAWQAHTAQALALQAAEYERRLEVLNNNHEMMRELTRTFLTQRTFEEYVKNRVEWADAETKRIYEIEQSNNHRFWLVVALLLAGLVTLAVVGKV